MRSKSERLIRLFIELRNWSNVWETDVTILSQRPARACRILRQLRKMALNSPFEEHRFEGFKVYDCGPNDDPKRPTFYICPDGQRRFLSEAELEAFNGIHSR